MKLNLKEINKSKSIHNSHIRRTHTHNVIMFFFQALCGGNDPKKCPELWGVFNYMSNWTSGECGTKNGSFCVSGKNEIASLENTYYALCALPLGSFSLQRIRHFYISDYFVRNRCWWKESQLFHCVPANDSVGKANDTTLFSASTALLYSEAGHNIYKVFRNSIQTILCLRIKKQLS